MSLGKDLLFLILQFCDEENLKRTAHMLEQETGSFFDLKYFEELLIQGNWEEAEKYLSSFTVIEDNRYSTKIYFEIRKQRFLEALDKHEHAVALDILRKDLKVFAQSNNEVYIEMAQLLALDDFREHSSLASYGDTLSARKTMADALKVLIEANPLLKGRIKFPQFDKSRLRRLINQSLNWQHVQCANPHPQPHIDSLFTDHKCPGPDTMLEQLNNVILPPFLPSAVAYAGPITGDSTSTITGITGNLGNQVIDEYSKNRYDASELKPIDGVEEVASVPTDFSSHFPSEFPNTLLRVINMGSSTTKMDFHPVQDTLLLVGTSVGAIELWNVLHEEKLFRKEFTVWKVNSTTGVLSDDVEECPVISVNRVLWSPGGSFFGVAFSERWIHLYLHHKEENYFDEHLEIDAHVGGVNDLAFSKPNDKLALISCGDDKLIQVWDVVTGDKLYTFEGHRSQVYSLCVHSKDNIDYLFSVSVCGEIKEWLFDNTGSRAPDSGRMRMLYTYSTDGKRLLSYGTNQNGDFYIFEWNHTEGLIIRNYERLSKCSPAIVNFGTCTNQYLAAGEHLVKIWDMEKNKISSATDAGRGDLSANPYFCFNKKGNVLAVCADGNQVRILVNDDGLHLLQTPYFFAPPDSSRSLTESVPREADVMPNHIPKIVQLNSRCQSLLLVASKVNTNYIRRLAYTHSGNGILALAVDGAHFLWRWYKSDANSTAQATTKCEPHFWVPRSGPMINDVPRQSLEELTACFSMSKNDCYVVSSSGKNLTLYNMLLFKKIRNILPPLPAATCIVFYPPDNNIIAVGMNDSTILIYNIRFDKVISKLEGHSKKISDLAFSTALNLLVSSGVDTQIVVWDSTTWEKKKSTVLQISSDVASETKVELDKADEKHFLAVHEMQLAIYETTTLRRVKQWTIANFCGRISDATYSCDSELVYAAMRDGILLILSASDLIPKFEIDPSAYLPQRISLYVVPLVVSAHPYKASQLALGLSNGGVVVIEPIDDEGKWTAQT